MDEGHPLPGYVSRKLETGTTLQLGRVLQVDPGQKEITTKLGRQSCTWEFHPQSTLRILHPMSKTLIVEKPTLTPGTSGKFLDWVDGLVKYEVRIPFRGDPDIVAIRCNFPG